MFEIPQGAHYGTPNIVNPFIGKRSLSFSFTLDESCLYKFNNENDKDLNKMSGIAFGFTGSDSARNGWRVADFELGIFELHAYIHINGVWVQTLNDEYRIGCFKVGQQVSGVIDTTSNQASWTTNVGSKSVQFVNTKSRYGYVSQNYFGGNEVAPHRMTGNYNYSTK